MKKVLKAAGLSLLAMSIAGVAAPAFAKGGGGGWIMSRGMIAQHNIVEAAYCENNKNCVGSADMAAWGPQAQAAWNHGLKYHQVGGL